MPCCEVPSAAAIFGSFLRLGITAFGGPAMIAHIREMSVRRNRWLTEETFKNGVVICQSVPGATAMQMAAYVGLRMRGVRGAVASYAGFGLPAFLLMLTLAVFYSGSREMPLVVSLFRGLQVMVVAIVANATFTFGWDIGKKPLNLVLSAVAAALFGLGVSPFAVIVGAAIAGGLMFKDPATPPPSGKKEGDAGHVPRSIVIFVILAFAVVAGLYVADGKLYHLAALMLRIDLFAFGGGYASLPLMFHEIVNVKGWLDGKTFMDGIALGQVTPGPIVITATFVGYLVRGFPGALVATLAIFTPSFVVLVAATPFFDRLKSAKYFSGATRGVLASFVGLLFYMTVRFAAAVPWDAVKVLFGIAVIVALVRKVNILPIVLIGSALSIVIFR
ncbi:chromate efflux transporter [Candidatus Deferrimicrobium sp.]|uniref:chromate efflux transporter n=1 Tax=Candidatus Deferrimicrobium sp. TaxID=3060586 RepID=UPI003C4BA292